MTPSAELLRQLSGIHLRGADPVDQGRFADPRWARQKRRLPRDSLRQLRKRIVLLRRQTDHRKSGRLVNSAVILKRTLRVRIALRKADDRVHAVKLCLNQQLVQQEQVRRGLCQRKADDRDIDIDYRGSDKAVAPVFDLRDDPAALGIRRQCDQIADGGLHLFVTEDAPGLAFDRNLRRILKNLPDGFPVVPVFGYSG